MIYTVTFNPSLDYMITVENFQLGRTNRTRSERMVPGGKGVNVSTVLQNLGISNTALGFVAGFTGEESVRELEKLGVTSDFVKVEQGLSRINIKFENIESTEINGSGPVIGENEIRQLLGKLENLEQGDVLVLAGSIPGSLPDDVYQRIMQKIQGRGVTTVVDAAGDLLLKVLEYRPFLIKPNLQELEELFGVKLKSRQEIQTYAKRLQEMGAKNVLVSMGGDGALLCAADGEIREAAAPKGTVVNTVGAGDSMVAGFLAEWLNSCDYGSAFFMGIAAGSASAFSENLATQEEIAAVYETMTKNALSQ